VKKSLSIDPNVADAWILLALLFSTQHDLQNALNTIQAARSQHPQHLEYVYFI
jgi:Tfp pilus assembly protein PilF